MIFTSRVLLRDLAIAILAIGMGVVLFQSRAPRTAPVPSPRTTGGVPIFIRTGADRDFNALTLRDLPSVDGGFTNGARYQDDVFLMTYGRLQDPVPARILRYRIADGELIAQLNPRWGPCGYPVNLAVIRDTLYLACRTSAEPVVAILAVDLTTDRVRRTYGERDGFRPFTVLEFHPDGETLWVSGDSGIARIDTTRDSIAWYGEERGVPPGASYKVKVQGGAVKALVGINRSVLRIRYDPMQDRWILCRSSPGAVSTYGAACSWYEPDFDRGDGDPDATIEVVRDRVRVKVDGAWRVVPLHPRVYYAMSPRIHGAYFLFSSAGIEVLERGHAFPTLAGRSTFDLRPYQRNVWPVVDERLGRRMVLVSSRARRHVVILYAIVSESSRTVRSYTLGVYDRTTHRYVEGRLDAEEIPASSPLRYDYSIATESSGAGFGSGATARVRSGEVEVVASGPLYPSLGLTINLADGRVRALAPASP